MIIKIRRGYDFMNNVKPMLTMIGGVARRLNILLAYMCYCINSAYPSYGNIATFIIAWYID